VLDPDIVVREDTGSGTLVEVHGAENVARRAAAASQLGLVARPALINGAAGWVSLLDGEAFAIGALTCRTGGSRPWTSCSTPTASPASTSRPSTPDDDGVEGSGRVGHMTRFVVDCGAVLHLASEGIEVPAEHELLAPTLLRSQTLSVLHQAVHEGEIAPDVALNRLARIRAMPIRLLGDAVLRRRAWDLAQQLGWAETYDAEYVALTQLQADAFVTLDTELARRVEGVVPTATIEALQTA
jgi:predicted nucleic acid-binding protein